MYMHAKHYRTFHAISHVLPLAAGTLQVTIKNGQVIDRDGIWSDSDAFVILKTNGHTCQTGDDTNDNTPEWNYRCPSWSNIGDQVCQVGQAKAV